MCEKGTHLYLEKEQIVLNLLNLTSTLCSVLSNSDNLLRRAACLEAQVIPFKVIKLD